MASKTVVFSLVFEGGQTNPSLEWGNTIKDKIGYPSSTVMRVYDGNSVILEYTFFDIPNVSLGANFSVAASETVWYQGRGWRIQYGGFSMQVDNGSVQQMYYEHPAFNEAQTEIGNHSIKIILRKLKIQRIDTGDSPIVDVTNADYTMYTYSVGYPVLDSISVSGTLQKQYVGNVADLTGITVKAVFASTSQSVAHTEEKTVTDYHALIGESTLIGQKWKRGDTKLVISYSYRSVTKRLDVQAEPVYLHHLEAENVKRNYYVNEQFSYGDDFAVFAVYSDGTRTNVTNAITIENEYEGRTFVSELSATYTVSYVSDVTGEAKTLLIDFAVVTDNVASIALSGSPKTVFLYGDSFDAEGLVVTATMNSGQNVVLDAGEYSLSTEVGTTLLQTTSRTIVVTYGGKSASYSIAMKYLASIAVSGYKDSFYQHEYFDPGENFSVSATYSYSDGTADETVSGVTGYTMSHSTAVRLSDAGSTRITVTYAEGGLSRSAVYSVDVIAVVVDSISVDASALSAETQGEKLFYEGYTGLYANSGIVVTATYNNGDTATIPISACTFSPSIGSTFSGTGTKTVSVSYQGKSDSYEVTVVAHQIDHLSLDVDNARRDFVVGGKFNYNGLIVKAVYNSGYETTITDGIGGYSITPMRNKVFSESDYSLSYTVTVSYGGYSATYSVSVDYPTLDHIVLNTSQINLTPKNGDVWDPSLVGVTAFYRVDDGEFYEKEMEYSSTAASGKFNVDATQLQLDVDNQIGVTTFKDYEISVLGTSHFGSSTKTTSFSVSVLPNKQLLEIYLDASEAKTEYKTGERFTGEGFVIMAKFLDTEGYTRIAVNPDNASLQTANPYLGGMIYKAGRYEVTFSYTYLGVTKSTTAYITVIPSYQTEVYKTSTLKVVKVDSLTHEEADIQDFNSDDKIWALYDANDTSVDEDPTSQTYGQRKLKSTVLNPKCYGYIKQGAESEGVTTQCATVVLFDDYTPPIEGESNVSVTFPRYVEGAADKINKCTFGALYGNRNARNRLFVSGNAKFPNVDWHSEAVNIYQLDENQVEMANYLLTYFPDTSYQQYGLSSNAIVGYSILPTGDLFVIKGPSKQEPTFYTRSAGTMQAITATGSTQQGIDGSTLQMEVYTLSTGNVDEGGVSPYSVSTFNNETLFLTENGFRSVSPSTSISSIKVVPRSSRIDKAIRKEDRSKAFSATFGDFVYVFTGERAYAANKNCVGEDGQYEWFILDGIPATCAIAIDGSLWFGTADGRLCRFDGGDPKGKRYQDDPRTYVGLGGVLPITADDEDDRLLFNSAYSGLINEGDRVDIMFSDYGGAVYARLGEFASAKRIANIGLDEHDLEGVIDGESGLIRIKAYGDDHVDENGDVVTHDEYVKASFHEGRTVYIDGFISPAQAAANAIGRPYTIETMDPDTGEDYGDGCFKLVRDDGTYADLSVLEHVRISFRPEFGIVSDLIDDGSEVSCEIVGEHDHKLDVIRYHGQPMNGFRAVITHPRNVSCSYQTRPFDLGSVGFKKNVLSWTVVNDTDYRSEMDLGYRADNKRAMVPITGFDVGSAALDAEDYSFKRVSTLADALPHVHTRWKNLPFIDFISFVAGNRSAANCVLTNITILYTGGNPRKGDE